MEDMKRYYDLLGVTEQSSAEMIKSRYRELIAQYHPDKVQHLGKEFEALAEERTRAIIEAYRLCEAHKGLRRSVLDRWPTIEDRRRGPVASAQEKEKYICIVAMSSVIAIALVLGFIVSWWLALATGLIVLGAFGYAGKILNVNWPRKWMTALSALFIVLSAVQTIHDRDTLKALREAEYSVGLGNMQIAELAQTERDLQKKLRQAESAHATARDQVTYVAEYGQVATYTFDGYQQSGQSLSPFTPVSRWTRGRLRVHDGAYFFDCSPNSVSHYENLIRKCPQFPFPYLALSQCVLNKGDPSWRGHAADAQAILSKTTKLPLHSRDHELWLESVNKLLDPTQMAGVLVTGKKQEAGYRVAERSPQRDAR
jgi:hypothetical protein